MGKKNRGKTKDGNNHQHSNPKMAAKKVDITTY